MDTSYDKINASTNTNTYDVIEVEETDMQENKPVKTYGIAAMIFGILTIITNFISMPFYSYFPFLGLGFAIADKAKNKKMTGVGKGGLICTIAGYAFTAFNAIFSMISVFLFLFVYFLIIACVLVIVFVVGGAS